VSLKWPFLHVLQLKFCMHKKLICKYIKIFSFKIIMFTFFNERFRYAFPLTTVVKRILTYNTELIVAYRHRNYTRKIKIKMLLQNRFL